MDTSTVNDLNSIEALSYLIRRVILRSARLIEFYTKNVLPLLDHLVFLEANNHTTTGIDTQKLSAFCRWMNDLGDCICCCDIIPYAKSIGLIKPNEEPKMNDEFRNIVELVDDELPEVIRRKIFDLGITPDEMVIVNPTVFQKVDDRLNWNYEGGCVYMSYFTNAVKQIALHHSIYCMIKDTSIKD